MPMIWQGGVTPGLLASGEREARGVPVGGSGADRVVPRRSRTPECHSYTVTSPCLRSPEGGHENGGESPVWVSAQPMSPTMRQAVAEAKQRPPARHFEPSTLLEDGERDG